MKRGYDGRDPARSLIAALAAAALSAHVTLTVIGADERPWASATFEGARHVVSVKLTGADAAIEAWLATLSEAAFNLRHHIIADITVAERGAAGTVIEALTVLCD